MAWTHHENSRPNDWKFTNLLETGIQIFYVCNRGRIQSDTYSIRMDCAYSFLTNSASVSSTIFLTSLILSVCVRQIPHSLPPPKPIPMFGRLKIMSLGTHWPPLRWISLSPSGRSRERISGTVFALIPEPGRIVIPQTSWSVNVLDRRNKCSSLVKA